MKVHCELIRTVVKPSLTSGLQAQTIPDGGLKPLEQFQDKMVRRSCSQRRRSSVIPLEMILNIAPLRSVYHQSVLSLLYNIWVNPGSCSELLMKVLDDKSLKDTYWPHNVTRILNMYNLPGADVILSSEPVTKTCFKVYMRDKILTHYMTISEGRLMRSNLYRFIYKSDFSFNKKKLHPIIAGTHTRR